MTKLKKKAKPVERKTTRGTRVQQTIFVVIAVIVIASFIISLLV